MSSTTSTNTSAASSPVGSYSTLTHKPLIADKLEVGCLYLMISVPLPIYLGRKSHSYATSLPSDPEYPFATYEQGVTEDCLGEEFHWDLYWHTSPSVNAYDEGSGLIYRLRTLPTSPPTYSYDRIPAHRVRTFAQLVGLVRLISVPKAAIPHLTRYLDWLAEDSARVATRSFVWATMAYYRTRLHLLKSGDDVQDHCFHQFDISRLTAEVLSFAYHEVPAVLEGEEGPRPIIRAWNGVSMQLMREDDAAAVKRRKLELLGHVGIRRLDIYVLETYGRGSVVRGSNNERKMVS
ncbi:hypothetical protein Cob_v004861 [Colletotrichum orbiculare MAFF 240422]|uniref:Uncharacterized protein n=1 Tax=Colletotrichum orbiculare (strain 104-T / ATCC 96160 / CBS 514.97 / LARS 414 / MAFF 240422) TaxID=1213857 RepID=A0A484FVY2_COLOR|nr:hypothetical protein Cob_v004861 [Colletotrichum orbiculare MAFF 240422]